MLQKCISLCLVVALLSVAAPAFAGDEMNPQPPQQSVAATAATVFTFHPPAGLNTFKAAIALAPPRILSGEQNPPSQTSPTPNDSGSLSTKGKVFKWLGIAMLGGGGALIGRGVALSDPCKAYSGPGVICTSNYQEVRGASIGLGAALAGVGAVMLALHGRFKN
jgi:hypothetical protein